MHWSINYIGQPWGEYRCYDWFRKISQEQFGRDLPVVCRPQGKDTLTAAKWLNGKEEYFDGRFLPTKKPVEGDAVFLSGNGRTATHVGMVIYPDKQLMILHAVDGAGVVVSDQRALRTNNIHVMGYWAYHANPA